MVEHQDRHHAVVLTELLPEALLDRISGCVIELYVCQELGALPSSRSRRQGRGREKGRKEGAQPLPLVQFGLGLGGARGLP